MDENQKQEQQSKRQESQKRPSASETAEKAKGIETGARYGEQQFQNHASNLERKSDIHKALSEEKNISKKVAQKEAQKAAKLTARAEKSKKVAKALNNVAGKAAKVSKIATKLSAIISTIGSILIGLLVIVGILVFSLVGGGLLSNSIMKGVRSLANTLSNLWNGKSQEKISDAEIVKTLNYIRDMGYDLYGYGFITSEESSSLFEYDIPQEIKESKTDKEIAEMKSRKEFKIKEICDWDDETSFIGGFATYFFEVGHLADENIFRNVISYITANNYTYTVKNNNTKLSERLAFWSKELDGTGLISIYEEGSVLGSAGDMYHPSKHGYIKVDPNSKELIIKKDWINSRKFIYPLDGWTGKYGMPLEFLLSVHIATMSPDLTDKLSKQFKTDVQIVLHETETTLDSGVKFLDSEKFVDPNAIEKKENGAVDFLYENDMPKKKITTSRSEYAQEVMKKWNLKSIKDPSSAYNCTGLKDGVYETTLDERAQFIYVMPVVATGEYNVAKEAEEQNADVIMGDEAIGYLILEREDAKAALASVLMESFKNEVEREAKKENGDIKALLEKDDEKAKIITQFDEKIHKIFATSYDSENNRYIYDGSPLQDNPIKKFIKQDQKFTEESYNNLEKWCFKYDPYGSNDMYYGFDTQIITKDEEEGKIRNYSIQMLFMPFARYQITVDQVTYSNFPLTNGETFERIL